MNNQEKTNIAHDHLKRALQAAVTKSEPAPAALRARILHDIEKNMRPSLAQTIKHHFTQAFSGHYRFAWGTLAALVLCVGGLGLAALWQGGNMPAPSLAQLNEGFAEPNVQLLKIGFNNHIHCALKRVYTAEPPSFEKMAQELGPELAGLVPLVQAHVPADHTIRVAHHCQFEGRSFIHFILAHQQTLLSLVLTRKNGEAFDAANAGAIVQASGMPMHQMGAQNLEIVGFETNDYLGYVVSGLDKEANLQVAVRLAPAVRDFLVRLNS